MKKIVGSMIALSILLSACSGSFTPTAKAQTESTPEPMTTVEAEGKLMPDPAIELSFAQSGVVAEVIVQEGAKVASGQVLARLIGAENAEAAVTAAKAALLQSRQDLLDLKRMAIESAGDSELALRQARKTYDTVSSGWSMGDEDEATQLDLAIDGYIDAEDDYYDVLDDVNDLLEKNDSNQKRMDAQVDFKRYEEILNAAYTDLLKVAGNQDYPLEEKPAKILKAIGTYEQARALQARLNSENLDPEKMILAEAVVSSAENNLVAAEETAEYYIIRSPFDGQVLSVEPQVGETIAAGSPAIFLADARNWVVETKDLAEVDVTSVKLGQAAQVELDGFPGEAFNAHVTEIDPVGREYLGDMTYRVTLTMDDPDPRFLWNMTAVVTIFIE